MARQILGLRRESRPCWHRQEELHHQLRARWDQKLDRRHTEEADDDPTHRHDGGTACVESITEEPVSSQHLRIPWKIQRCLYVVMPVMTL